MKKTRERSFNDKKEKTDSMTFRIEPKLKQEYIEFCDKNGCSYGKRLRLLIKEELKNGK
jgi:hypothetical protein